MKRLLVVFVVSLVFVACGGQTESLKPLDKGMSNTVALPSGEVVYDIGGEWDAVLDWPHTPLQKDIIKITQEGNKFVGILVNGNAIKTAGNDIIKGELEKNGFKSLYVNTLDGWLPPASKIGKNCNKIVTKTLTTSLSFTLKMTLTRK